MPMVRCKFLKLNLHLLQLSCKFQLASHIRTLQQERHSIEANPTPAPLCLPLPGAAPMSCPRAPSAPHFLRLQHFDGRLTFAEAAEWPILDGMVLRLADAFGQIASRPAPQQQWVKCSQGGNFGCGAVFLKQDFEKHCGEVEHSDDFGYVTEPVDPPPGSC
jgi:hypothetical protein